MINTGRLSTATVHDSPLSTPDETPFGGSARLGAPVPDLRRCAMRDGRRRLSAGAARRRLRPAVRQGWRAAAGAAGRQADGDRRGPDRPYRPVCASASTLRPARAYLLRPDQHLCARWRSLRRRQGERGARPRAGWDFRSHLQASAHGRASLEDMGKLVTASQFPNPDAAYVALIEARRGLSEAAAAALDARLVLILGQSHRRSRRAAGRRSRWPRMPTGRRRVSAGPAALANSAAPQRVHSMATNCSQLPPRQAPLLAGIAPVISSLSTLRNDERLGELARLAVGGRGGGAATGAGGEAAVDAVAVGVVGDDEDALFRLRGRGAEQHGEGEGGEEGSHRIARGFRTRIGPLRRMRGKSLRLR